MERKYQNTLLPVDTLTQLHDGAAAVTADGAGQVASAAAVLDLGDDDFDGVTYVRGVVQIHVSAFDFTTGDETVNVEVQLSSDADFGTAGNIARRAIFPLGNGSAVTAKDIAALERYEVHVDNQIGSTRYRYMRLYFDVAGTSPSITCKAWFSKDPAVK